MLRRDVPLAMAVMLLAGCGTLLAPGPFRVAVDTEPSGAAVIRAGEQVGTTPCVVELDRANRGFELRLSGHHPRHVDVGRQRNCWILANVTNLGLGMVVDVALGAHENPDTAPLVVTLRRVTDPRPAAFLRPPRQPSGFVTLVVDRRCAIDLTCLFR